MVVQKGRGDGSQLRQIHFVECLVGVETGIIFFTARTNQGAEGGRAIVDVLFGNHNPVGRLPITRYPTDYVDQLPMTSMTLRPILGLKYPGRTYRFYNRTTVYPFGYGLSYTNFSNTIKSAPRQVSFQLQTLQQCKQIAHWNGSLPKCQAMLVEDSRCSETINIVVDVRNIGTRDGAHVVLVYSAPPSYVVGAPIKRLIGFQKVFLKGEHFVIVGDGEEQIYHSIIFMFDAWIPLTVYWNLIQDWWWRCFKGSYMRLGSLLC